MVADRKGRCVPVKALTVLIAEDEPVLKDLLARLLGSSGYRTLSAGNGEEALSLIHTNQVDILLSDIKMPGMDGMALLKQTKAIDPGIEVILMTAYATLDTAVNALRSGARDYIMKPFDLDEIIASVARAAVMIEKEDASIKSTVLSAATGLVARSPVMKDLMVLIGKVSTSNATVLIQGETGVGKELVAHTIHKGSSRREMPFIKVNCSALPETLLESELFGYEKGAFTGAASQKPGRFELAEGGTLFLDEIGDISLLTQVKLLRVLQHKEFERLGGTTTVSADVRIITATNKNLEKLVEEGAFREDLYYRLNVLPVQVPPLRMRREDIPELIQGFVANASEESGDTGKQFSPEAIKVMAAYRWPGNVRELENIIERLLVITEGSVISLDDLPDKIKMNENDGPGSSLDLLRDNAEEQVIREVLRDCDFNITKAAGVLGISRRSLHRKINKYGIASDKK